MTHLDPGDYTIEVHDLASIHNFHLSGPGVNMATDIDSVGTVTWNVTFTDGRYHFQCDPHPTQLHGDFTVGTVATTPTLAGSVGPGKTISLKTSSGAKAKSLPAGTYKLTAADRSKKLNFHFFGSGVNKKTAIKFVGKKTWTVTLKAGKTYRYQSDRLASRLRGTVKAT